MQEIMEIYYNLARREYVNHNYDDMLFHNKHVDAKWSSEISISEPLYKILLDKYSNNLHELKNKNFEIIRNYVNYAVHDTVDMIHEDATYNEKNFYTILQYGNFSWDKNWHGETVFYNNNLDEILFTTTIKPGRIIVFDSTIPHSARSPSRIAEYPRFTIATKIKIN